MKINKEKFNLILARKEIDISNLRSCASSSTLQKAKTGADLRPSVVGRIARALGVDPLEIMEKEE